MVMSIEEGHTMIPRLQLTESLEKTFRAQRAALIWELHERFGVLNQQQCEDLVQFAFQQALIELKRNDFELKHTWRAWLQRVAINAALSHLRRVEELSLNALTATSADDDSSEPRPQPIADRAALTPSQLLEVAERGERRRTLVSDLLRDYMKHVERYRMWVQAEVFERSLRGQTAARIATEMPLHPQRVYEQRARAFEWLRSQCDERDRRGSILASAFQPTQACGSELQSPQRPRRMGDVIRWAVDTVGALCPSPERLAARGPDVDYHLRLARWASDDTSAPALTGAGPSQSANSPLSAAALSAASQSPAAQSPAAQSRAGCRHCHLTLAKVAD
jgi:DNA-directed RNA polymerase specialized sigma24 family protein